MNNYVIFVIEDPGTGIKFNSVTIPGCTAAPCSFKKETNQSMSFNFTASEYKLL